MAALFADGRKFTMSLFFFSPEKLSRAKEENVDMHKKLDMTLLELNNL